MGIQINGNNDSISALDGSWTAEGASINTSGILTATTFKGNVTGTACTFVDGKFTGNVTIGGTLTYEDVTNIDSVGIITANAGIHLDDVLSHKGNTNTKIRFPANDTVTVETAGTERLRITSDGKYYFPGTGGGSGSRGLEIDTEAVGAQDEGVILNARASGTTGRIKFQTNSATAMTILGNGGEVLIGGHSSAIQPDSYASHLEVHGTATDAGISILRYSANSAGPTLLFGKSRGSSIGAIGEVQENDSLGKIEFYGTDTGWESSASIRASADGEWYSGSSGSEDNTDAPGRLEFHTTPNGADNLAERLRITSDGKVGINETTPEELLDLGENNQQNLKVGQRGYLGQAYSTAATILGHSVKAKTTGTTASGMIVTETNSGGGAPSAIRQVSGTIQFHTAASGTADADFDSERLRINSSGQMGLGMSPGRMFEVKDSTNANRIMNIRGTGTSGAYLAFLDANTTDDSRARVGTKGGNTISLRGDEHHFDRGSDGLNRMVIDSSGRLLVGHTASLDQNSQIQSFTSSTDTFAGFKYGNNASPNIIRLGKSRNTSYGGNTIVADNDEIGRLLFSGNDGSQFRDAAYISGFVDGSPSTGTDMPGRLAFFTSPDGSLPSLERLRIQANGNVGIARTINNIQTNSVSSLYDLSINRELNQHNHVHGGLNKSLNVDNQYTVETFRSTNTNRNSTSGWMDIAHFRAWDIDAKVIIQAGGTFTGDQVEIRAISSYNSALNNGRSGPYLEVKSTQAHTGDRFTKVRLGCDNSNRQPILQVYFDGSKTHNSLGTINVTVHDYGSNYGCGAYRGEAKFQSGTTLNEVWRELLIVEATSVGIIGHSISHKNNMLLDTDTNAVRINPPPSQGGSTVLHRQALIGTKHIYTAYHNFSSTNSNMNITSIRTNSCGELWVIGGWANGNGLRMKKYTWVASGDTSITEQFNQFASRYGVGININTPTMSISGDYVHFNFTFSDNQGSKMEKLKIHFEYFHQFLVDS